MNQIKTLLFSFVLMFCMVETSSALPTTVDKVSKAEMNFSNMSVNDFLTMSPRQYRNMTGQKLGLKNTIKLKVAQKVMKKKLGNNQEPLSKGLYVLLAILGWGFLGMGLGSDWEGSDWIICLVLTALCWLPGVIYALAKMGDYYD